MNAWLTPNEPPAHRFYTRKLVIPATFEWLAILNGALSELTYPWNYEKSGDLTPEQTAEIFSGIYQTYAHNDNEPPDWETPDDADGTPEQPWYEDLADWIIEGFLAVTFTPAAALTYQAVVPKLRVAIRTGNLGALFRVLINGIEVWSGDSYAPITDLIDQVFDMTGVSTPYTVRVEHNGVGTGHGLTEAKLEVIRLGVVSDMVQTILREDPTGCGVQWSTDDGGTWSTIDLSTCITGLANDAINQAITDGVIQGGQGGQPGPTAPPAVGTCRTYHVFLRGDSQWHLPSPLGYNDTVTVSNLTGGWSDGTLAWYCADGARYLLGACSEDLHTHEDGDVLNPGAWHMALVMKAGTTWFEAPVTPFTNTSGTTPIDVVFQANDGTIDDNTGQIEFDVEVCTTEGWTHTFDFTASEQGWASNPADGTGWGATYGASGGSNAWYNNGAFAIGIAVPSFDGVSVLNAVSFTGSKNWLYLNDDSTYNGVGGTTYFSAAVPGTDLTNEIHAGSFFVLQGNNVVCHSLTISGIGVDPFA